VADPVSRIRHAVSALTGNDILLEVTTHAGRGGIFSHEVHIMLGGDDPAGMEFTVNARDLLLLRDTLTAAANSTGGAQ
jgi:hypothetical protein